MSLPLYKDEALESFLIRAMHSHGCDSFKSFANEIIDKTLDHLPPTGGAFSSNLANINICYASVSSNKRVAWLMQLQNELNIEKFNIFSLCLLNSNTKFSPRYASIKYQEHLIPFSFVRKDSVPICPECLLDETYIRQWWHFLPYSVCHHHHCELLSKCPECNTQIDYLKTEQIAHCACGLNLRKATVKKADGVKLKVTAWLHNYQNSYQSLPTSMTISERYGFFLWYINRYSEQEDFSLDCFHDFCSHWPSNFQDELALAIETAESLATKPFKDMCFTDVFNNLLNVSRFLPCSNLGKNIVLKELLKFLSCQYSTLCNVRKPNFTQIKLSVADAATLLSCRQENVYRLYSEGKLQPCVGIQIHTKLPHDRPAFRLSDVIATRISWMNSENDGIEYYLSDW